MNLQSERVYGERIGDLLPALFAFRDAFHIGRDGMWTASVTLKPDVALPLHRALMRAEAELLLEDADTAGTGPPERATPAQRRHDALMRLVTAVGAVPTR